jgi:hypothetical protein
MRKLTVVAARPERPPVAYDRRVVLAVALAFLLAAAAGVLGTAQAAPTPQGEEVYRCKSASGQSYFGQNIPPECMGQDVEVLDRSGRVVRTLPGRAALEQIDQQKAAEAAKAAALQRDRTLLATYLTVADIERLRDQRVELLEQQNIVTRQYITNLRAREARLMEQVQRFKPYSDKPNAPPLPEQIASEIINTVKGREVYEQELVKNTAERERLTAEFAADIARFKELKGLK